jgi:non-heme chloroperoxidase
MKELPAKDWGEGRPIVFSHGWPLNADAWDDQLFFFGSKGYRVIAHDRRGHGRSDQPSGGYDYDTFAADLAAIFDKLELHSAERSAEIIRNATLKVYAGASHGLMHTHKEQFNADLLAFIKGQG